jgi:glycosyltransferase involved in cell wall biosynthesis
MTKSIAICGMFRRDQLAGGLYSFFENLMRGFAALKEDGDAGRQFDTTVFCHRGGLPWHDDRIAMRTAPARLGRLGATAWVGAIGARGFDAVLFPNYFAPPAIGARRRVAVIHDLQYRHMPQFFSPVKRNWLEACHRLTLRKCQTVVAISEVVRQDILHEFGARWEGRVRTIHDPVSLARFDGGEQRFTAGRPYILCAAMDRPQKNLHTLVRAFDRIKQQFGDHVLVMAGQLRRMRPDRHEKSASIATALPPVEDLVQQLGLGNRVIVTGFVSDAELGALYRGASAFVLPSLFEGFGMPAVEALALGAPTLVSDLPVLREVTLGKAQYVANPQSVDELSERLAAILSNVEAARPAAELMRELRDHYAPATVARQYYEVLVGCPLN